MTIQQLSYVSAVIQHGSFSKAATQCYVTQPTLSAQISKLESELGVEIINRQSHPLRPTPAGKIIVRKAREALHILDDIPRVIEDGQSSLRGKLRLGIIPTLSQYLLPLFLKEFVDMHPRLQVGIYEKNSAQLIKDIQNDIIDVALLALPSGRSGLTELSLFDEKFYAYIPDDLLKNITFDKNGNVPIDSLNRQNMLLLTEGHCLRDQIVDLCRISAQPEGRRLEFETGSLESIKSMVEQGMGYSLIPELATENIQKSGSSSLKKLSGQAPTREIGLVHHPGLMRSELISRLVESIQENLPENIRKNEGVNRIPWRPSQRIRGI